MNIEDVTGRVEITALGARGDGLAGEIAIPYTLPGDVIENAKLVTQSPDRITPVCSHFGTCGGCVLQHASDAFLADWKTGIVKQALRSQGLPEEIRAVHVSPPGSRRRVVFSGRRTKKTVQLGFYERRSEVLVPIQECALLVPELMDAVEDLKAIVRLAATRTSVVKLALSATPEGLDLAVTNAREIEADGISTLAGVASGFARVSWNDEVVLLKSQPVQQFGKAQVVPPAGAFLQATQDGEDALVHAVLNGVGTPARVMDLFAGCGTFSLPMAEFSDVHAVEFDDAMLKALDAGWRQAKGLKQVSVETRDLFRRPVLRSEFKGFDAVVLDPPRAGAAAQVEELAASQVARVLHVSCNPVTFARDARVLVDAGFTLDWMEVVDQFRWSPHVELVGCFSR